METIFRTTNGIVFSWSIRISLKQKECNEYIKPINTYYAYNKTIKDSAEESMRNINIYFKKFKSALINIAFNSFLCICNMPLLMAELTEHLNSVSVRQLPGL